MTIREYAKNAGFEIIGKLVRHPEYEGKDEYIYIDEADNCYIKCKKGIVIVTKDDSII